MNSDAPCANVLLAEDFHGQHIPILRTNQSWLIPPFPGKRREVELKNHFVKWPRDILLFFCLYVVCNLTLFSIHYVHQSCIEELILNEHAYTYVYDTLTYIRNLVSIGRISPWGEGCPESIKIFEDLRCNSVINKFILSGCLFFSLTRSGVERIYFVTYQ